MKPVRTATTTAVLGQPKDWDTERDGICEGLPIASAHGVMFSYGRPNWREFLAIIFGRPIRLGVFGAGHPPVSIDTEE